MVVLLPKNLSCRPAGREYIERLRYLLVFQFGRGADKVLDMLDIDKLGVCFSKTTQRPRALIYGGEILAAIRASDFYLVLHMPLGKLLHRVLPYPLRRVAVVSEMVDDILEEGHTVFAKHVIEADESIRPFEEVLVVDESDRLIGVGRALLDYETMVTATYGPAVQLREKEVLGGLP